MEEIKKFVSPCTIEGLRDAEWWAIDDVESDVKGAFPVNGVPEEVVAVVAEIVEAKSKLQPYLDKLALALEPYVKELKKQGD